MDWQTWPFSLRLIFLTMSDSICSIFLPPSIFSPLLMLRSSTYTAYACNSVLFGMTAQKTFNGSSPNKHYFEKKREQKTFFWLFQIHYRKLMILIRILQSSITPKYISMIPDYSLSSSLKQVSWTLICVTYQSLQRLQHPAWSRSNQNVQTDGSCQCLRAAKKMFGTIKFRPALSSSSR